MLNNDVYFLFYIMKEILDFSNENLVTILGRHGIWINSHACQPNLEMIIYVL